MKIWFRIFMKLERDGGFDSLLPFVKPPVSIQKGGFWPILSPYLLNLNYPHMYLNPTLSLRKLAGCLNFTWHR